MGKTCRRNLILIHHETEVWGASGPTGELIAAGDKLVRAEADLIIRTIRTQGEMVRDEAGKPIMGPNKKAKMERVVSFWIEDCRGNSALAETEFPWLVWNDLMMLVQA